MDEPGKRLLLSINGGTFLIIPIVCLAAISVGCAHVQDPSLDVYARGETTVKVLQYGGESLVTVFRGREMVHRRSLFSDTGQHGDQVVDVKLSPDGHRVAYQFVSSGGHQPCRSPIMVVNTATGDAIDVEKDLLDAHAVKDKCPHYRGQNIMQWKDDATLIVPVCNVATDAMNEETLTLRVDK